MQLRKETCVRACVHAYRPTNRSYNDVAFSLMTLHYYITLHEPAGRRQQQVNEAERKPENARASEIQRGHVALLDRYVGVGRCIMNGRRRRDEVTGWCLKTPTTFFWSLPRFPLPGPGGTGKALTMTMQFRPGGRRAIDGVRNRRSRKSFS